MAKISLNVAQSRLLAAHRANLARLGLDPDEHDILFERRDDGSRHYERVGDGWDAVVTERGCELELVHLADDAEALYRLASDQTFAMACSFELANRREGADSRRLIFAHQLHLIALVSPEWEARLRAEHGAILALHPFLDVAAPTLAEPVSAPRSSRWIGPAIIGALILAAVAAHYPLWFRWHVADLLSRDGIAIEAMVTGRSNSYPKAGQTYHLDYRYRIDGRSFVRSEVVEKDAWSRYEAGDPLTVLVARSDPTIAAFAPQDALARAIALYGVIDALLLLLIGGGLWRLRRSASRARAREDEPTT